MLWMPYSLSVHNPAMSEQAAMSAQKKAGFPAPTTRPCTQGGVLPVNPAREYDWPYSHKKSSKSGVDSQ
jgi:hypothetical protein